jgi:hypothetical protein
MTLNEMKRKHKLTLPMLRQLAHQGYGHLQGLEFISKFRNTENSRDALRRRELLYEYTPTVEGWRVLEVWWAHEDKDRLAESAGWLATGRFRVSVCYNRGTVIPCDPAVSDML